MAIQVLNIQIVLALARKNLCWIPTFAHAPTLNDKERHSREGEAGVAIQELNVCAGFCC